MIGAVFALALLLSDPGSVQTSAGPAAPASDAAGAKPKVNRDGLICHTEEVLGSRIPKKVCYTPEQAEARSQQDRQNLERSQSQFGYNRN